MGQSILSVGFIALLIILGTTDAYFMQHFTVFPEEVTPPPTQDVLGTGDSVAKQSGPVVTEVLASLAVESQSMEEPSIIRRVIPPEISVPSLILLKDGDRIGLLSWTETPQVKNFFLALKEALHESFSPGLSDLVDETHTRPGKPVRNFLTFKDPALSSERLVFIRVRERLYEFHIAEGKDDVMLQVIEALTE